MNQPSAKPGTSAPRRRSVLQKGAAEAPLCLVARLRNESWPAKTKREAPSPARGAFLASARNGGVLAFHDGALFRDRRRSCHGRNARTRVQREKAQVCRKASAGIGD